MFYNSNDTSIQDNAEKEGWSWSAVIRRLEDIRTLSKKQRLSLFEEELYARIEVAVGGRYVILLNLPRHGDFSVELMLGGDSVALLSGHATCPADRPARAAPQGSSSAPAPAARRCTCGAA